MKYLGFTIENYRAVEYGKVPVSNNLIPFIGINESGKTTVLQAVLAFDKNNDRYNKGAHLEHKNKYEIKETEGKITADILIDSDEDLEVVVEKLNITAADPLFKALQTFKVNETPISLVRSLPGKQYSLGNAELQIGSKKNQKDLALALYERLPFILYFDDFNDRVPEAIDFVINKDVEKGYVIPPASNQEWHLILEEVFKRATKTITLTDFLKIKDPDDQENIKNDIQDILHKEVVEDWKNLKKKFGAGFGEEKEDLKMQLDWEISDAKDKVTFTFQVQDKTTGKGRQFNISKRSKGFQWFFNFIMKLKFNPKYQENQKGAIYLLDEPGSYLHTSAQTELLKKLQEISDTNTILYCTHSQFLLDPDVINIARIKIVEKDKGKIEIVDYNDTDVTKNAGALTPLHQALHIKSGFYNKEIKHPVITEGITDFYLFNLLKKHRKGFFKDEVEFIPGAGADHLKDLISHAIAFSDKYLVLLDSDEKGRNALKEYKKHFGDTEADNFFMYTLPKKKIDVILEDHLSVADKKHIEKLTGIENTKSALPVLYYADEKIQKDFIDNLSDTSIKNLAIVQGKANSIVA